MVHPPDRAIGPAGCAAPQRGTGRGPAQDRHGLRRRGRCGTRRDRGRHRPRREGGRVLHRAPPRRPGPGAPDPAGALRMHLRGHQQPRLCRRRQGRRRRRVDARGPRHRGPDRRDGRLHARNPHAVPHPRPAGHADHPRQGARRGGVAPAPPAGPDRAHRIPGQDQWSHRHLRRPLRIGARRRLAGGLPDVRRGPRTHVEPADHADRVARLAGRALRGRRPVQPHPPQLLHRRLELHLHRLLRADPGGRRHGLLDDAAQDQPDPLRERRGQPGDLQRPPRHLGATW